MDTASHRHDIVAVGGSAGSLQPLRHLLGMLPSDLSAALFIVVHTGATSHLAQILGRGSALPVQFAANGARIERGCVYVAPPGYHLLLHGEHCMLRRGPRENMARPAIDPLFRSAACSFGGRVIGMVLSGGLSDGTAGLLAIKRCGGIAMVQDPREAVAPDMPRSALRHVEIDHCLPIQKIGGYLAHLVAQPAVETFEVPLETKLEAMIAAQELEAMISEDWLGAPSRFSCPECRGSLWEIPDADMLRYRCRVGHAYTAEAMPAAKDAELDRILWRLLRSHEERAALTRRLSLREAMQGHHNIAAQFEVRAEEYARDAKLVRRLLLDHSDERNPTLAGDPVGAKKAHGEGK